MSDCDCEPIVMDFGSDTVRVGFAGEEQPHVSLPCFTSVDGQYLGGVQRIAVNDVRYPITCGEKNWENIETIVENIYEKELKISSEERSVLWTEKLFEENKERMKITEIMFEKFHPTGFYTALQPVLTSYASGRSCGIFIDSGHIQTQIAVIYEGYLIDESCCSIGIGGSDVTEHLQSLLKLKNFGELSQEVCKDIKDKHSYCHVKDDAVEQNFYILPDKQTINLTDTVAKCTEPLFNFSLFSKDLNSGGFTSVQDMIYKSVMKSDVDLRCDMMANIVLSGGNTMVEGIQERLQSIISDMTPMKSRVVACPDRSIAVWIGGSILASLSSFQPMWITPHEYAESGPNIVRTKCDWVPRCSTE